MMNTSTRPQRIAVLFWIGTLASLAVAGAPPVPDPVGFGDDQCVSNGDPCFTDADCTTGQCPNKARYISFTPPSSASVGGEPLAIRVTLTALPQFPEFDGEVRWVGAPGDFPLTRVPADGTFKAAALQCDPLFMNWSTVGVLHVYGSEVVPSSQYEIRTATAACVALGVESCLSPAVTINTNKFADVVSPFGGGSQPNPADVSAVFRAFTSSPGALSKPRAQQAPDLISPFNPVIVLDATYTRSAFRGSPFPGPAPLACPRPFVGCGDGRIDPPEECDDGGTTPGDGCDASCRLEDPTLIASLLPISPEAPLADPYPTGTVISGSLITLPSAGVRVFLELTFADWDPDLDQVPKIGLYQVTLDDSGFTSPGRGSIGVATEPCDASCQEMGFGVSCTDGFCDAGFATLLDVSLFDGSIPSARLGGLEFTNNGETDPGTPVGFGIVVFDVSEDAWGTFTVAMLDGYPNTFVQDRSFPLEQFIGIAELRSATIVVNTGCCGNGVCLPNNGMPCPAGTVAVPKCFGDCNGNGTDDACEDTPDCNGNDVPDVCDTLNMTSRDCDGNKVPDECQESDCNGNGVFDACDVVDMTSPDCNGNRIPDECDLVSGRSTDVDADGLPDECDAASRYVVVTPVAPSGAMGQPFALRVAIIDAPQFPASVGAIRWLSAPVSVDDGAAGMIAVGQTQCNPVFVDWSMTPVVGAFGADIVPGSVYEIRSATEACVMQGVESCMSPPVLHATGKWGDAAFPWGGGGQPNFGDVNAEVAKFQGAVTAPSLALTDVTPEILDQLANFADISAGVQAFKGGAYPFSCPGTCP